MSAPHNVPLDLRDPMTIDDARDALRVLSAQRRAAVTELDGQIDKAAAAERDYRKALAQAYVSITEGTAAAREAAARSQVADKSYDRDIQVALVKSCTERVHGLDGERASLHRVIEYSMQVLRLTESAPVGPATVIGGRRAA